MRRRLLALLPLAGLAACATQPPDFSQSGTVSGAFATAERNLGDMSRYRGNPADAARACAQFLTIIAALQSGNTMTVVLPQAAVPLLQEADREVRDALGIPRGTDPTRAAMALRAAADALDAGNRAGAAAALSDPAFTLGPQRTLEVLGNLPRMPAVESVAPQIARATATL
jgi:hypothetical protein